MVPICHPGEGRRYFTTAEWRVIQSDAVRSTRNRFRVLRTIFPLDPGLRRDDCVCHFAPFACFADSRSIARGVGSRETGDGRRETGDGRQHLPGSLTTPWKTERAAHEKFPSSRGRAKRGTRDPFRLHTTHKQTALATSTTDPGSRLCRVQDDGTPCWQAMRGAARAGRLLFRGDGRGSPEQVASSFSRLPHRSSRADRS